MIERDRVMTCSVGEIVSHKENAVAEENGPYLRIKTSSAHHVCHFLFPLRLNDQNRKGEK